MTASDWEVKIVSSHISPLSPQVTEAHRISRESPENILNSKNEFRSNNLPELENRYGCRVGNGGVKRKRFGNIQEKHPLSAENDELVGEDEGSAHDLPRIAPEAVSAAVDPLERSDQHELSREEPPPGLPGQGPAGEENIPTLAESPSQTSTDRPIHAIKSSSSYDSLKWKELVAELRKRKLGYSGNKDILEKRLREDDEGSIITMKRLSLLHLLQENWKIRRRHHLVKDVPEKEMMNKSSLLNICNMTPSLRKNWWLKSGRESWQFLELRTSS